MIGARRGLKIMVIAKSPEPKPPSGGVNRRLQARRAKCDVNSYDRARPGVRHGHAAWKQRAMNGSRRNGRRLTLSVRLRFYTDGSLSSMLVCVNVNKVSPRGAARRYAHPRRWQFDPKIAANRRPSADGSAVRTSLVAGGG